MLPTPILKSASITSLLIEMGIGVSANLIEYSREFDAIHTTTGYNSIVILKSLKHLIIGC